MVLLAISLLISFLITLVIIPHMMKFLYFAGIAGLDIHKKGKPKLPASGGICVAFGILAGLLTYVGLQIFVFTNYTLALSLLAAISAILIVTLVGLFDDLNVRTKPMMTIDGKNVKIGIPRWVKPLLTLPAAVPLMVINAGESMVTLPFVGLIDVGILYPLLFIPIGIVGASNMVNMLGGFNGVEAGMGLVYMLGLGLYAMTHGGELASVIFLSTFAALIPFLIYNWYPAKILPGDSLTYLLGSIVATGVIVGNTERIGLCIMSLFILQGILKFYSWFKLKHFATDLGVLQKDGSVKSRYGKRIFSLTHLVMNTGRLKEWQVSITLILIQLVLVIFVLMVF